MAQVITNNHYTRQGEAVTLISSGFFSLLKPCKH